MTFWRAENAPFLKLELVTSCEWSSCYQKIQDSMIHRCLLAYSCQNHELLQVFGQYSGLDSALSKFA